MLLSKYPIEHTRQQAVITVNEPSLALLQYVLNHNFNTIENIDFFTARLKNVLAGPADSHMPFNGYHDWEDLNKLNYAEDVAIFINKPESKISIINEITGDPIVEIPIAGFIDVLAQWRSIQEENQQKVPSKKWLGIFGAR
ncbi:MAG TPA: hypothetical protein VEC12_05605 [Bacteroidia bacterium]|nr:hypothetical protein [Bacteroidia bacterium]